MRTVALFILLSTANLFARTCPLRRQHKKRNAVHLRVRGLLKGASVLWAFCIVAHLLPVAYAGKIGKKPSRTVDELEPPHGVAGRAVEVPPQPLYGGATGSQPPPLTGGPPSGIWPGEHFSQDVKFAVGLYEFQRPAYFFSVWSSEAQDEDELTALVLEEQVASAGQFQAIPVRPQPRGGAAAYIVTEIWNSALRKCPVLIQVYAGPIISFVEHFDGPATVDDVRLSVGVLWPPGGKVYIGDSLAPLPEDDQFNPCPGLLVRISPPSLIPGTPVTLQTRLSSPREWFADVELHGYPTEKDGSGKICVLGVSVDQQICKVSCSTTAAGLRQHIADQHGRAALEATFCTPRQQLLSFASRGTPVRSVIGLIPPALQGCLGIFVDARSLACKVQFVLIPNLPTKLDRLLYLIGAERPHGWEIDVTGALNFCSTTETLIFEHASLIRLVVKPRRTECELGPDGFVKSDSGRPREPPRGPSGGAGASSSYGEGSGQGVVSVQVGGEGGTSCAPLPVFLPAHEAQCSSVDEQPVSKTVEVASLVAQTDTAFAPLLLDAPELLDPPTFFADRAPPQAPAPVDLRDSRSPEAEFRRVTCCILGFQRRPDFRTLGSGTRGCCGLCR